MTCLIKFISKGAPWRLMNLKIQRQFLFKLLFGLECFQLGSLDACVCAYVSLLPRLIKVMEWVHKGLRPDDRPGMPQANSKGTLVILNGEVLATEVIAFLPRANGHLCPAIYGSAELCFILYLSPLLILVEPSSSGLTCWQTNSQYFAYTTQI